MTTLFLLLGVCTILGVVFWRVEKRWRKVAATRENEAPPKAEGPAALETVTFVVPEPYGSAHSRAALAALESTIAYIRARLTEPKYGGVEKIDARALAWLLEQVAVLPAAVTGDSRWGSEALKRHLHEIDAAVAPGSWWHTSQQAERPCLYDPEKTLAVPQLGAVYDAVFEAQVAKRLARRRRSERKASSFDKTMTFHIGRGATLSLHSRNELVRSKGDA